MEEKPPTARPMKETEPRDDFSEEKAALESLLDELYAKDRDSWPIHPAFGHFTKRVRTMQYKHLDHHLDNLAYRCILLFIINPRIGTP